jgi:hypothetical protein
MLGPRVQKDESDQRELSGSTRAVQSTRSGTSVSHVRRG